MIRKLLILIILVLIVSTTFIKNHTKKLDNEIFSLKENINYLNSVKELVQLEHGYLSSPEKLVEFNNLYFDNKLRFNSRENIKVINNINQIKFKTLNQDE
jgi:Predicted secreted (periplasmic) protein|tara:strand:+ start:133 stop:432 length:300 start_codon:yes stop_codon:yes gene_type:complete